MKSPFSRSAQPRRRRNIYHLALGVLMLLACCMLTSCNKEPLDGDPQPMPTYALVSVVNNCDKLAHFEVADEEGAYGYQVHATVDANQEAGPWRVYNYFVRYSEKEDKWNCEYVDIEIALDIISGELPTRESIFTERFYLVPDAMYIFTINPDYTVECMVTGANPK